MQIQKKNLGGFDPTTGGSSGDLPKLIEFLTLMKKNKTKCNREVLQCKFKKKIYGSDLTTGGLVGISLK